MRATAWIVVPAAVLLLGGWWLLGSYLAADHHRNVGRPPASQVAEVPTITRADGGEVAAWYVRPDRIRGAVLLAHPMGADRRAMLPRARFLAEGGYASLLIDLRAHGETTGTPGSYGYLESRDVAASLAWLRQREPDQPIAMIGASLGGAAALLGDGPVAVDALVLESVYSDIRRAIDNRMAMHLGEWATVLSPLLMAQFPLRLGLGLEQLSPLAAIERLQSPVLIVGGREDRHTQVDETERLFQAAQSPKALWLVDDAGHVDLHRHAPADYERRILDFLHTHLHNAQMN